MQIGYARTSTIEQVAGFEAQHCELRDAGCERLYSEQVSSVATRLKLDAALADLRKGDVLVVTKLDRLARSMRDLMNIVEAVAEKGATLRILAMPFINSVASTSAEIAAIVCVSRSVQRWRVTQDRCAAISGH